MINTCPRSASLISPNFRMEKELKRNIETAPSDDKAKKPKIVFQAPESPVSLPTPTFDRTKEPVSEESPVGITPRRLSTRSSRKKSLRDTNFNVPSRVVQKDFMASLNDVENDEEEVKNPSKIIEA